MYQIKNINQLSPFLMTLTSAYDHWMYISSTGCLTAGRSEAQHSIFPYVTDDLLHQNHYFTGPVTIVKTTLNDKIIIWKPFSNDNQSDKFQTSLYKDPLGNQIIFEEINHELKLKFTYSWQCSQKFGFIRNSKIENIGLKTTSVKITDGLRNIMPPSIALRTQQEMSNLANAYKVSEYIPESQCALYYLNALIMDRPEPGESLATTLAWSDLDLPFKISLNETVLDSFFKTGLFNDVHLLKGKSGSFLINFSLSLNKSESKTWNIVCDTNKSHRTTSKIIKTIKESSNISHLIKDDIKDNHLKLNRYVSASDGNQLTNKKVDDMHHKANVLFNIMRGGVFHNNYQIKKFDLINFLKIRSIKTSKLHTKFLNELPNNFSIKYLILATSEMKDKTLMRLSLEYLPLTFGRRHGDPSRPWNYFKIKMNDDNGEQLYYYEGNWRDIFQNWEALGLSYPMVYRSIVSKFLNATTIDGYNPYRITSDGIDWEVEDKKDPWSHIGYWSDHQIIYLLKLLEHYKNVDELGLHSDLNNSIFCYSNLPYELKDFKEILSNPKDTITFNHQKNNTINKLVKAIGTDAKLVLNNDQSVYHVNMIEKLLVLLLAKISNFIPKGGIWMNTQRPEWNDANNALAGFGLSMVTVYYLKRFTSFLINLLNESNYSSFSISEEVCIWYKSTNKVLTSEIELSSSALMQFSKELGETSSNYRTKIYKSGFKRKKSLQRNSLLKFLKNFDILLNESIQFNLSENNLYHGYNILSINLEKKHMEIENLYLMLEGQVSALSSKAISPTNSIEVIRSLFKSKLYRKDQNSFLLYPEPDFIPFFKKNIIPNTIIKTEALINEISEIPNNNIIEKDFNHIYRFNRNIRNVFDLELALNNLSKNAESLNLSEKDKKILFLTYEKVFQHKKFTGRSGTMFSYEGIGSIYWHMISKLLLSVQELFFEGQNINIKREDLETIGTLYYRIRSGLSANKTPKEYGAFPFDPYSHTPSHSGAQQPGMTGQVKEEILTRFGELGCFIKKGEIHFNPKLLRISEFLVKAENFYYTDTNNKDCQIKVEKNQLAFTYCQVPIIYELSKRDEWLIEHFDKDGKIKKFENNTLNSKLSKQIFERKNNIEYLKLHIPKPVLLF